MYANDWTIQIVEINVRIPDSKCKRRLLELLLEISI